MRDLNKQYIFSSLLIIFGFVLHQQAYGQTPVTQWDRGSAMAAVRSVNIDAAVHEIGDISSLADAATTLNNLKNIETRSDWPMPAREAVIYQFTRSLADLPRETVAIQVMQYLRSFQAQTLVPFEDHGEASVPLFNIRGAAAGIENGWQRTEFTLEAVTMLEEKPALLVSSYITSSNHNQRSGYLDALRQAEMADVVMVQNIAIEHLGEESGLTSMLGETAVITADPLAVQQLLSNGRGAGLSSVLVQLDKRLQRSETASLLLFAIEQAPARNATLAIAAWWPRLSHDPEIRELMLDTLADPVLGASAALALAQNPDIQTIRSLQKMAGGDSPAAQRAQMALDLNRDGLIGEIQP